MVQLPPCEWQHGFGNDRQHHERILLRVMANGLVGRLHYCIDAERITSIRVAVRVGKVTVRYLQPDLVARKKHVAGRPNVNDVLVYYDGWSYEGGAWSLAFQESWPIQTLALVNARRSGDQSLVAKIAEATGKLSQTYTYLPLKDYPWLSPGVPAVAGYFYDWIGHNTWDDYWQQWSI